MKISREDLQWATSNGLLTSEQAATLWQALENRYPTRARFDGIHVAYYFGALIVISAMGWFMNRAWEQFGGDGIFIIATIYALCFLFIGQKLWTKPGLKTPGGLFYTMAVCMIPLAIYGLERMTGIWPQGDPGFYQGYHVWVKGSWFLLEMGTILAALITLKFIRFPFLMAPIALSLWYMSMDLAPLLFGKTDFTVDERKLVSLWFGLAMLCVSYVIDRRTKEDYAFWGYLFGLFAFWGGLSLMESTSEWSKFLYCLINVVLIMVSVILQRRMFMVFGVLGVFGYIGHLAYRVFENSLLFPFALSIFGIFIIYLGLQYQRHRIFIETFLYHLIPEGLRQFLPTERISK
ncbi:MAG: DUF2157 domain-containing protein [Deltaproteobacteria bacterium RIFCSPLOWO2_02_FULL_44_10]|nr:MAG: DUF2157 domain-containing protein [Deltaproteobacteria bacterium RIFCSPHIGHO2_02_FULL_44_16]OGQ47690.1 MAG: DUF2157 domain-containing protein [Deltaproteobacteria bacterium RIFCSPLOWO2_02_FULL_44_10]